MTNRLEPMDIHETNACCFALAYSQKECPLPSEMLVSFFVFQNFNACLDLTPPPIGSARLVFRQR